MMTMPSLTLTAFPSFKQRMEKWEKTQVSYHKAIASENYEDVQLQLYNIVHRFIAQVVKRKRFITRADYDSYFEEAMSEANYAFMTAFDSFDPTKRGFQGRPAAFTTWMQNSVRFRLLDWWNATVIQSERYRSNMADGNHSNENDWFEGVPDEIEDFCEDNSKEKKTFDSEWFLERLSDDAKTVARIVLQDLSEPIEWDWLFANEWQDKIGLPEKTQSARKAVKQKLLDWGWSLETISDTWHEIMDVLGCIDKPVTYACYFCKGKTANEGNICTKCMGKI